MAKTRLNTRRHLHRAQLKEAKDAKTHVDMSFMYQHNDQMRKLLRGVDLERYERLTD